jgi:Kef-type K+ transport system membrane component KefB
MHNLFYELTLVCILAGGIAVVTSFFKQPTILAYIATGLLLGPLGYYNLQHSEIFTGLSEIGVTLLLFLIGLELDVSELKKMGPRAVVVGVGQVLLTTALGLVAMSVFGLSLVPAAFIAVALSFSSTVITTKLLAEKKDTQSLYGKLSLTILVIQDFFAIGLLVILNNIADPTTASDTWQNAIFLIAKLGVLLWLVWWHNRYVFPKIMRTLGRSEELLLIFALAWALGLAALVSLPFIGLSREVGGFLAGLALAGSSLHYEISHRVKSLRDFFLILFFILLGANVSLDHTGGLLWPAIGLTAFV